MEHLQFLEFSSVFDSSLMSHVWWGGQTQPASVGWRMCCLSCDKQMPLSVCCILQNIVLSTVASRCPPPSQKGKKSSLFLINLQIVLLLRLAFVFAFLFSFRNGPPGEAEDGLARREEDSVPFLASNVGCNLLIFPGAGAGRDEDSVIFGPGEFITWIISKRVRMILRCSGRSILTVLLVLLRENYSKSNWLFPVIFRPCPSTNRNFPHSLCAQRNQISNIITSSNFIPHEVTPNRIPRFFWREAIWRQNHGFLDCCWRANINSGSGGELRGLFGRVTFCLLWALFETLPLCLSISLSLSI